MAFLCSMHEERHIIVKKDVKRRYFNHFTAFLTYVEEISLTSPAQEDKIKKRFHLSFFYFHFFAKLLFRFILYFSHAFLSIIFRKKMRYTTRLSIHTSDKLS